MNDHEKYLLVLAHALAHQENEIHYLKAMLLEKTQMPIEEYQREQEEFWEKSKHYRIYETLKNLEVLQSDIEKVPEDMDLNKYMDHLRWPSDPSEDKA
ncbi:MAG: hypothetical protein NPIRA05_22600 [Nitrospirales bacterium]|nr:MAG: hypothetical protein NPIRA05_22600 [Nitrospirales bacterium]